MSKKEFQETEMIKVQPISMAVQQIIEPPVKKQLGSSSTVRRKPAFYTAACQAYNELSSNWDQIAKKSEQWLQSTQRALILSKSIEKDTDKIYQFKALFELILHELKCREEIRKKTMMKLKKKENQIKSQVIQTQTKSIYSMPNEKKKEQVNLQVSIQGQRTNLQTVANTKKEENNHTVNFKIADKGRAQLPTKMSMQMPTRTDDLKVRKSSVAKDRGTLFQRFRSLLSSFFSEQSLLQSNFYKHKEAGKTRQSEQQQRLLLQPSCISQQSLQLCTVDAVCTDVVTTQKKQENRLNNQANKHKRQ